MKLFQIFRSRGREEPEPEEIEGHINTMKANLNWDSAIANDTPSTPGMAEKVVADGIAAEAAMALEDPETEVLEGHINTVRANLNWDAAPFKEAWSAVQPEERVAPAPSKEPLPQ